MWKLTWGLLLDLIKKYSIYLIAIIIVIPLIYTSVDKIMGIFGFDTKDSLRQELVVEQVNKETAISANKALVTALEVESLSNELGLKTTTDFFSNKEEIKEFYRDSLTKLREDLALVKALDEQEELEASVEPVDKSKGVSVEVPKKVEHKPVSKRVATVQINAIWNAFEKAKS